MEEGGDRWEKGEEVERKRGKSESEKVNIERDE